MAAQLIEMALQPDLTSLPANQLRLMRDQADRVTVLHG